MNIIYTEILKILNEIIDFSDFSDMIYNNLSEMKVINRFIIDKKIDFETIRNVSRSLNKPIVLNYDIVEHDDLVNLFVSCNVPVNEMFIKNFFILKNTILKVQSIISNYSQEIHENNLVHFFKTYSKDIVLSKSFSAVARDLKTQKMSDKYYKSISQKIEESNITMFLFKELIKNLKNIDISNLTVQEKILLSQQSFLIIPIKKIEIIDDLVNRNLNGAELSIDTSWHSGDNF